MPPKTVIIKKYENRRLYDATNSRYVNLDEIARMVREGYDLQVQDAATGEDLTRLILTQIIVDDAKEPDSRFPLDILRQMVVASGKATQESTLNYMKAVADVYQNAYRALTPTMSPFEFLQPGFRTSAPVPEPPPADASAERALHKRIEELEATVQRLAQAKATTQRRKRPVKARKKSRS